MPKISIEDLKKIKERERGRMILREGEYRAKITVHMGTCGIAAGAREVMTLFRDVIGQRDIDDVILTNSGCAGLCAKEPMITVEVKGQSPVKYILVDREKAMRIFEDHVLGGKPVEEYALAKGSETAAT
ncbi:MAG: (2Fe-2S) ferredoxin domain-containing protein [Desulfomonile sp.]|nr:(2Fe-2S) ferredoxin domain-containing protein [Desulfomonile sp.]